MDLVDLVGLAMTLVADLAGWMVDLVGMEEEARQDKEEQEIIGEKRQRRAAPHLRRKSPTAMKKTKWFHLSQWQCGTWGTVTQSDVQAGGWLNLAS